MAFVYARTIRFHETDAAGVVYFARLLTLCHEAYEASLAAAGVDLRRFFSSAGGVAVPVIRAEADFFQPMFCGDMIAISLKPKQLSPHSFEIVYTLVHDSSVNGSKPLAQAVTRHVCISTEAAAGTKRRRLLTSALVDWIDELSEPLLEPSEPDD